MMVSIFNLETWIKKHHHPPMSESKWSPVKGFPDFSVSKAGQVRGKTGKILSPSLTADGYGYISLISPVGKKKGMVHRMVATTFIPNPSNLPVVNHKNGIRNDNCAENLEWVTHAENSRKKIFPHAGNGVECKVVQISMDGNRIKIWDSIKAASEGTGIGKQHICECCQGKGRTAGGWQWKYQSDEEQKRPDEEWKSLKITARGKEKLFNISSHGRSRTKTGKIITGSIVGGYVLFCVHRAHRLVATAFCPNDSPETKTFVNHKDGNKLNNHASNLEWTTPRENTQHAVLAGLLPKSNPKVRKPVRQTRPDGQIIVHESASAAALASGVFATSIIRICKGKGKTAGGSKWEYAEAIQEEKKEHENALPAVDDDDPLWDELGLAEPKLMAAASVAADNDPLWTLLLPATMQHMFKLEMA